MKKRAKPRRGAPAHPGDGAAHALGRPAEKGGPASARREAGSRAAGPSPATQRPCFDGSGGGSVFQTSLLTKTVVLAVKGAQSLFHALFGVKTLSGTLLGPDTGLRV